MEGKKLIVCIDFHFSEIEILNISEIFRKFCILLLLFLYGGAIRTPFSLGAYFSLRVTSLYALVSERKSTGTTFETPSSGMVTP